MPALKFALWVWGVSAVLLPNLLTPEQFSSMAWDLKVAMFVGQTIFVALVAWPILKKFKQMEGP